LHIPEAAYINFSRRLYDYSKNSEVAFGSSLALKKTSAAAKFRRS